VALELPLMLLAAWWICGVVLRRNPVPHSALSGLTMGGSAFLLLMAAEMALAVLAFGRTPADHWASFAGLPEQLGLAGQLAFAFIPLLRRRL
jgi:hypothetical protein